VKTNQAGTKILCHSQLYIPSLGLWIGPLVFHRPDAKFPLLPEGIVPKVPALHSRCSGSLATSLSTGFGASKELRGFFGVAGVFNSLPKITKPLFIFSAASKTENRQFLQLQFGLDAEKGTSPYKIANKLPLYLVQYVYCLKVTLETFEHFGHIAKLVNYVFSANFVNRRFRKYIFTTSRDDRWKYIFGETFDSHPPVEFFCSVLHSFCFNTKHWASETLFIIQYTKITCFKFTFFLHQASLISGVVVVVTGEKSSHFQFSHFW